VCVCGLRQRASYRPNRQAAHRQTERARTKRDTLTHPHPQKGCRGAGIVEAGRRSSQASRVYDVCITVRTSVTVYCLYQGADMGETHGFRSNRQLLLLLHGALALLSFIHFFVSCICTRYPSCHTLSMVHTHARTHAPALLSTPPPPQTKLNPTRNTEVWKSLSS
jgi:hypothetical protein